MPAARAASQTVWHNGQVREDALPETLRRVPLLATLPATLFEEIAPLCACRPVAKGEFVFGEGDAASFLPILLTGRVKLFRIAPDGREQVLHLVRAPASFAEAAVFGPGVFPATAQALAASELATLPRERLLELLSRRPEVALAMLASISYWLRRLVDLVDGLSLHTVEERVAAYLWSAFTRSSLPLVRGVRVRLEDPKHLIAALCGTAPEVLSRTFRKLEAEGIVTVEGPVAALLDAARLQALASAAGAPEAPPL
jgi:CRP/FNR family transcriptional regulator, dissimilatory nitrate respiration regulator